MSPRKGVRILSICDDEGIRFSRELVLKQEGYQVESMTSHDPIDPARTRSFHIAVLCHSLSADRAAQIAEALRQANPNICVVRVHAIRSGVDHRYDADCEVLPGPGQLLDGIKTLCARFERPGAGDAGQRKRA